jgi:hypothetical protein
MNTKHNSDKSEKALRIGSVVSSISVNDLISTGFEESYYEWHKCPKCDKDGLSKYDSYCSGCGVKVMK